jgi:hypothetical protein
MTKSEEELFLYYKGPVLYDTIGYLICELKEKMFAIHTKQAIYKKVLMVMIEALENVFKYHEFFEKEKNLVADFPPEISILKKQSNFTIACSNPVLKRDVPDLKERLDRINTLDRNGVKDEYKKTITNGQFTEKGGAGLGLIEMAKISDDTLNYTFTTINDFYDYYRLTLIVNIG